MAEPTTLQRCVEFFDKHGWPWGLQKDGNCWLVQTESSSSNRGSPWVWVPVSDKIVIPLMKEQLWEMIKGARTAIPWPPNTRASGVPSRPWLTMDDKHYEGDDELALLLAVAEGVMK